MAWQVGIVCPGSPGLRGLGSLMLGRRPVSERGQALVAAWGPAVRRVVIFLRVSQSVIQASVPFVESAAKGRA